MKPKIATLGLAWAAALSPGIAAESGPAYTSDNRLVLPADYREWIFLSSGLDMNYAEAPPATTKGSNFGNVFVNPEAYRAFVQSGLWPDKTILVLENRTGSSRGSINKHGKFQTDVWGMEFHVKDAGVWTFYATNGNEPAKKIPERANCYSCHEQHAAVDTTFVQFYPTLLPIAKAKGTLSPAYLKADAPMKKQSAIPSTQTILRAALDDLEQGRPSYDRMTPDAARALRADLRQYLQDVVAKLGPLKSVYAMGSAAPDAQDPSLEQYQATYDRGWIQWRIAVQPDGTISRLVAHSVNAPGTD